jgi:hypothetical protein
MQRLGSRLDEAISMTRSQNPTTRQDRLDGPDGDREQEGLETRRFLRDYGNQAC